MKIKLTSTAIKSTDAEFVNVNFYVDDQFTAYLQTNYVDTKKIENKQMINDTIIFESKQYSRRTTTMTFVSEEAWEEYKNDDIVKNSQLQRRIYNFENGIKNQTVTEVLVETPT